MATMCPYCNIEVSESAIEAEDGCCPECGSVITIGSMIAEDEEESDGYKDEHDDTYDGIDEDEEDDRYAGESDDLSIFDEEFNDEEFNDEEFTEEEFDEDQR